ncbi:GDSL esterase/lipase [Rhynchospora pubera]|uniref:GDSL esterase/lipase n=1 Tax=Rhynchospora pubera TaxID=906938 RepID=A0AAV8FUT9_9POAL|nr:GDSL esterase/lipase [Rhynchospora pubera]
MKLLVLRFLLLISCFSHSYATKDQPYNAIFSFGNSYADTGNFVTLENGATPYEHLPYGMTYFGEPTGRASDGRLVIDFIAQALGLPLIPPYFSHGQNFSRGANFAVIGATALSLDYLKQRGIPTLLPVDTSINTQLGWFDQLKPLLCDTTESCQDFFSRSLFILGEFGGNDYAFILSAGKSISEVQSYMPVVIDTIRQAAESLLKQGALHIIIPGILPSGCVPIRLTTYASKNKSDYDSLGCLKEYNTLGFHHNMMLKETVAQLQSTYPLAKFIYADYYEPVIQFLQNPNKFGFTVKEPLRICCGGGGPYNYNSSAICGQPGVSACSNPSTYINWDGIHLTEAAYKIIATGWLNGRYAHPPISFSVQEILIYSENIVTHW